MAFEASLQGITQPLCHQLAVAKCLLQANSTAPIRGEPCPAVSEEEKKEHALMSLGPLEQGRTIFGAEEATVSDLSVRVLFKPGCITWNDSNGILIY